MSHTTTLKGVSIKSRTAVEEAVRALAARGKEILLESNAVPRAYYDNQIGECDMVLKLKNSRYDVGLKLNDETGEYDLQYDNYVNEIGKQIGVGTDGLESEEVGKAEVGMFLQEYTKAAAIEQATAQGMLVSGCELNDRGEYELIMQTN